MPTTSKDAPERYETASRDSIWIESSEQKDAARALEMLHVQLISAVIDPYSWKWVMASLHHAVQAFLLASLAEGRATETPRPGNPGEWFAARYADPAPLADAGAAESLPELYAQMKVATGYRPDEQVDQDLSRLATYHEALMHRMPREWKLRVNDLPRVTRNVLSVIEFVGWNPGHIEWHKETLTDLARVKLLASMKVLEALEGQYRL